MFVSIHIGKIKKDMSDLWGSSRCGQKNGIDFTGNSLRKCFLVHSCGGFEGSLEF